MCEIKIQYAVFAYKVTIKKVNESWSMYAEGAMSSNNNTLGSKLITTNIKINKT